MNKKRQLKVILAAFLQGIVIFMMVESAHGQNWVYVTEDNNIKFYSNKDNISFPSPNIVRIWEKIVTSPSEMIKRLVKSGVSKQDLINKGYGQYSYSVVYKEYNCKEKTSVDLSINHYDILGSLLETFTYSGEDKSFIVPDSIADVMFKVVCK